MNVIMLVGGNSCGKTATLNIVYKKLFSNNKGISTNRQQLGNDPNDFLDIVLFSKKQIAFFTMGDYSYKVKGAMIDFNTQGVNVLVCACNNRFVKPFKQIQKYPSHHIIIKTLASATITQSTANIANANSIFLLI